jgi:hypothetical protein
MVLNNLRQSYTAAKNVLGTRYCAWALYLPACCLRQFANAVPQHDIASLAVSLGPFEGKVEHHGSNLTVDGINPGNRSTRIEPRPESPFLSPDSEAVGTHRANW